MIIHVIAVLMVGHACSSPIFTSSEPPDWAKELLKLQLTATRHNITAIITTCFQVKKSCSFVITTSQDLWPTQTPPGIFDGFTMACKSLGTDSVSSTIKKNYLSFWRNQRGWRNALNMMWTPLCQLKKPIHTPKQVRDTMSVQSWLRARQKDGQRIGFLKTGEGSSTSA